MIKPVRGGEGRERLSVRKPSGKEIAWSRMVPVRYEADVARDPAAESLAYRRPAPRQNLGPRSC